MEVSFDRRVIKSLSVGGSGRSMGVDRGVDQLLHMVRRIASERWISAAEREVVGKFSGLSWMVKNIGASKVPGRRECYHRTVSVKDVAELLQGGMGP